MKVKVKDLPPGRLVSVEPQATIAAVARQMRIDDSESVVVMSEGHLVGIITERDLARAMVAIKMIRLGVRHLPVVNKAGKPIGLVSAHNLVAMLDRSAG